MIRTQIQLTEEQSKNLKRLASKKRISIAELIRQGVNSMMRSGEAGIEERKKRAIIAAGRFHSGEKDISAKHDDYLTKAFSQ